MSSMTLQLHQLTSPQSIEFSSSLAPAFDPCRLLQNQDFNHDDFVSCSLIAKCNREGFGIFRGVTFSLFVDSFLMYLIVFLRLLP